MTGALAVLLAASAALLLWLTRLYRPLLGGLYFLAMIPVGAIARWLWPGNKDGLH